MGRIVACAWLLFLIFLAAPAVAEEDVTYQIKASYIYNFMQFVRFSEDSIRSDNRLNMCIIGENRFGSALREIDGAPTPQGVIRISSIQHYRARSSIQACHMLYLVGTDRDLARRILGDVDTSSMLTVGEFNAFIQFGGFIELFLQEDSIRFRVNKKLAGETRFEVPAQLLSLGVQS